MEERSLGSKITESLIRNRPMINMTEDEYRKKIMALGENDNVLPPIFIAMISIEDYKGIKVYKWNSNKEPDQTIIFYVHGGEFVYNPLGSHFDSLYEIAKKTNSMVILPIYHKLPNYTYKDNYPVLISLYKEVLTSHPNSKIILMGDSAGGGMALVLAQLFRSEGIRQPNEIILISPWVDLNTEHPQLDAYEEADPLLVPWKLQMLGKMWAGDRDTSDPMVSPIFGDFNDLAHITLFVGTREIFFPDIIKLDKILTDNGIFHDLIVGQEQNHVYVLYPIPEGKDARAKIINIINQTDIA